MIDWNCLATYVVNLPRRTDRRAWISTQLPAGVPVTFTSDLDILIDGHHLAGLPLTDLGIGLFDWQITSDNRWWNRPLKYGEIGCSLAHVACWNHAANNAEAPYVLILEDDALFTPDFPDRFFEGLEQLNQRNQRFDLLYLGRAPIGPDTETEIPGIVRPGYSYGSHAYLLTRNGISTVLDAKLSEAIIPLDEFLPAMFTPHPRPDVHERFPVRLEALAFDPPLAHQRHPDEAGSDTEASDFVPDQ